MSFQLNLRRPYPSLLALLVALPFSSCTLLYCFNNDPAGLPCDFTASQEGACLEGYTCVEQANNEFICLVQGALNVNEPCASSDQCGEDLTCATLYGELCAGDGADDPICSLVDNDEKELACRVVCDITDPRACPEDTLCVDGEPDFCQAGTCATDSDCELIAGSGAICQGEGLNEGRSGLCFEACNPLACDPLTGVCPDCAGVDGNVDPEKTCVPVLDEPVSNRNICDFAGVLPAFADCTTGQGCVAGTFCGALAVDVVVCVPWCNAAGGAPECPIGSACSSRAGDLGICLPQQ